MPLVIDVFDEKTNKVTQYWGFVNNVLWRIDDVTVHEKNGFTRIRMSSRQFFLMYIRYCQIMRFDGEMKKYQYDKPLGT